MASSYSIDNNIVRRGEDVIAIVQVDGSLLVQEGMEKYRTQAVKELAKVGRRRDDGTFIFEEGDAVPEEPADAPEKPESAPVERRVIATVRELVAAVEGATGEKAPELSKLYGDETPEVWAYLRRHVAVYNNLKQSFDIRITNNHIEE